MIKCINASNLLESIEILYKLNNLGAYFCQYHWLQYIVLVFFFFFFFFCILGFLYFGGGGGGGGYCDIDRYFWGCQKLLVFFFGGGRG